MSREETFAQQYSLLFMKVLEDDGSPKWEFSSKNPNLILKCTSDPHSSGRKPWSEKWPRLCFWKCIHFCGIRYTFIVKLNNEQKAFFFSHASKRKHSKSLVILIEKIPVSFLFLLWLVAKLWNGILFSQPLDISSLSRSNIQVQGLMYNPWCSDFFSNN